MTNLNFYALEISVFYKVGGEKEATLFFLTDMRGINGKWRMLFGRQNVPILSFHIHKQKQLERTQVKIPLNQKKTVFFFKC